MRRIVIPIQQHERPIAGVLNKPQVGGNRSLGYDELRLHVSDLIKVKSNEAFCEREHVIRKLYSPSVPLVPLPASRQLMFDMGNALHDSARSRWIAYNGKGRQRVLARWSCLCGRKRHVGVNPDAANICKRCHSRPTVFNEYEIFNEKYSLVAHPDFNIVRGMDVIRTGKFDKAKHKIRIVEFKGIDRVDLDWYRFDAPLGEHTLQGDFYYWLHILDGYKVDETISYVYGDRNLRHTLYSGEPWKEFEVKHGEFRRIKKFLDKAERVKQAIKTETVPKRALCDAVDCARAKNCSVANICFSMAQDAHKKVAAKGLRAKISPLVISR